MDNWEIKKLGGILTLEYGSGLKQDTRTGSGFPVVGSSGVIGYHSDFLITAPGIVVGRKGTVGGLSFMKNDFWPIDTAYFVKPKLQLDWKWLYYTLSKVNFKKLSLSDVVPGLKRELVYNVKVNFPQLSEQKAIAEILSTVDDAIQKSEEAIAKTDRLKREMMNKLFTHGIGHKNFKETKIGKIPIEWEFIKFGNVLEELYRYPTYFNIEYVEKGVPEIRGELIRNDGSFETDYAKYRFISEDTAIKFPRTILREGDFVMSVRGTMGKIALIPSRLEGSNITANLIRIALKRNLCFSQFFKYFFLSKYFQGEIQRLSPNTTIKTIQAPTLKSIDIILPPLAEQKEITIILNDVNNQLLCEKERKQKFINIKKSLMNDLLTGKKRVKLN